MKVRRARRGNTPLPRILSVGVHTFAVHTYTEQSIEELVDIFQEINPTMSKTKIKRMSKETYIDLVFELGTNTVDFIEFYEYFF